MNQHTDSKVKWSKYYANQKKFWQDPSIHWAVKLVVREVELHRSDSKGWFLSVRRIAGHLNISTNTCRKAIDQALDAGYLEANRRIPRKRRKLRLSVSLRAPVEFGTPSSKELSHWEKQPVSPTDTPTVSSSESVNNKEISNANINDSYDSQVKTGIGKSPPYKKESKPLTGYQLFLKQRKELGL